MAAISPPSSANSASVSNSDPDTDNDTDTARVNTPYLPSYVLPPPSELSWPIRRPLSPDRSLHAIIYHHQITTRLYGEIHCWTYISQGLSTLGAKEVVFTIQRRVQTEGEGDFPHDPFEWFRYFKYSATREVLHEFQGINLPPMTIFGRSDIEAFLCCASYPIDNVPASYLPEEWFQIIPLLKAEVAVYEEYGPSRPLSHLGCSNRWFPFPPWFDRDRTPCITTGDVSSGVGAYWQSKTIIGISAVKKGSDVVLYISELAEPLLKDVVQRSEPNLVFSLNTLPFKKADSGLLWSNKFTGNHFQAYSAGNSTNIMNLNFLAFSPNQQQEELRLYEDGYIFELKNVTWMGIRSDIENSLQSSVTLADGGRFLLKYERLDKQPNTTNTIPAPPPVFASAQLIPPPPRFIGPLPPPPRAVAAASVQPIPRPPSSKFIGPLPPPAGAASAQPIPRPLPPGFIGPPPPPAGVVDSALPIPPLQPKQFIRHRPENIGPRSSHIHCDHIVLLDTNPVPDINLISDYIRRIEKTLDEFVPKTVPPSAKGGGKLLIEFDVGGPGRWDILSREWVKWSFMPDSLSAMPMTALYRRVNRIERPNINTRIRFQLAFNAWGFKGQWT
ncbi:hypothetical protein FQN57_004599 [Myotisia sp. PD_48]|nr:hypothetical protein FQN57_004599 [Myotisia sp. PD_48]